MSTLFTIVYWIFALIICVIIAYGSWIIARKINYSFGYESQVEETIRLRVKPECLVKK